MMPELRGKRDSWSQDEEEEVQLSPNERLQLETCFRSLSTQVFVCGCAANLYTWRGNSNEGEWELRFRGGVPVVLLDKGEARSRTTRGIRIVLAERGSSFSLWTDKIDNLSSYKVVEPTFHTMCLSSDHTTLIGFGLEDAESASELWSRIELLTSDPENISLSVPGAKCKARPRPRPRPRPLPPKSHISQPCCFQHVTSVGPTDKYRYVSLQTLVPPAPVVKERHQL